MIKLIEAIYDLFPYCEIKVGRLEYSLYPDEYSLSIRCCYRGKLYTEIFNVQPPHEEAVVSFADYIKRRFIRNVENSER